MVRSRPGLDLRVPPRGGQTLLRTRGRGRPRLRDGALGHRLRRRPELQLRLGRLRPGQPELVPLHRSGGARERRAARPPGLGGRAGADRDADGPLPGDRGRRGRPRLVRGARSGDAYGVPVVPRRPRRRGAVRRGSDERHSVADVGPPDRATGRGRPHRRGARRTRARPRHARGEEAPGRAAHVPAPDGDVPDAGGRLRGRRPAPRPGPRRRPPAAHALPHRRADRRLPGRDRGQPGGVRGRPAVRRGRGRDERLHPLPRPRPALPGVRRDVRRRPEHRSGRRPPAGRGDPRVAAPRGVATDGGLPRGVRPDPRARADPVRDVGGR